jgi:hypothetical protein
MMLARTPNLWIQPNILLALFAWLAAGINLANAQELGIKSRKPVFGGACKIISVGCHGATS